MPYINTAVTVSFVCWDTANNAGKTGDASNITLRGVRDGTLFTPSAPSITQVDSTNLPGVYKASLTASENNGTFLTLGGKSSSTGCVIIPVSWSNELTGDAFARLGAPSGASIAADIGSRLATSGYTAPANSDIAAIKAKTDNLPASPAAVGSAMTLTSAYDAAKSAASQTSVNSIPTNPLLTNDARLGNLDATISSRSTLTAAQVWANATRTLSSFGTLANDTRDAVWGATTRTLTSFGTLVSDVATAVWGAGTRTLTAISDSSGVTTLLSRIGSALTISSGKVTVGTNDDKTGYSLSSSQSFNLTGNITGNLSGSVGSVSGAVGSVTGNVGGNVAGSVNSVTSGVTVTTNNDKTGYALSAAGLAAIWDRLTSALTTAGSIGKLLVDNINATISSRSTYAGGDTAGTTTLLSRISSALSFTGSNVHVHVKAKDNLDFGALEKASLNAATPSVTVSDKTGFSLATPPPTAAQIRSELDSNSAKLANLDTAVSSRLAADEYNDMADSIDLIVSGVADGVLSAIWGVDIDDLDTEGSIGQRLAAYFATTAEPAPDLSVSALKICNDALTLLGNSPITSLAENTKAARLCSQFYASAGASVLRAYNWNCATARAELTADTEPPEFGFAIRYALPGDCLRVVAVSGNTHEWKIENGYILTNSAVVQIIYIKRISASEMDVMLSEAVAVKLASLIAFPLTNSATVAKAMFDLYKEKLADAHTMDAFENGTGEHLASDTWINARGQ